MSNSKLDAVEQAARDQFVAAGNSGAGNVVRLWSRLKGEDDAAGNSGTGNVVRLWARLKGEDEGGVAGAEGDAGPKLLTNTEPDPEATL